MSSRQSQMYFFSSLFLAVALLGFFIFLPYLGIIAVIASLAVVLNPIYKKLAGLLKHNDGLAATLTILATLLIIFLPLFYFGTLAYQEAKNLHIQINNNATGAAGQLSKLLEERITDFYPQFSFNLNDGIKNLLSLMVHNIGEVFAGITESVIVLFLSLIAFYYFLKDGKKFIENLVAISPLPNNYDEEIFSKLGIAVDSIVKGTVAIVLFHGIAATTGYLIFQVPNPALLGSMAAIAALVPGIGPFLISGPVIAFLFLTSNLPATVGLLIWSIITAGTIDNIIKPKIVGRGVHIHPFLVLISVLGGLKFFGIMGFLLGPIVLSLLFALGEVYSELIENN